MIVNNREDYPLWAQILESIIVGALIGLLIGLGLIL